MGCLVVAYQNPLLFLDLRDRPVGDARFLVVLTGLASTDLLTFFMGFSCFPYWICVELTPLWGESSSGFDWIDCEVC